jgi:phosphoglycerate dehydrogenase-like enzyme
LGNFFHPKDLERLRAVAEVRVVGNAKETGFATRLADADILLGSWGMPKLDADVLSAAPRLRAVCYAAGSVKGFVTDASYARGITVTTAMHANAIPVAQWTVALITLINKGYFACRNLVTAKHAEGWRHADQDPYPGNYRAAVVGIVGFGAIGRLVVDGCRALGVTVLVADPIAKPAQIAALGAEHVSLLECARRSHVLSLHAPNIDACAGMMNAEVFAAMPDGAAFINTARGRIVDEAALIAELQRGRITAHLDVTHPEPAAADSPLWTLPNCHLTPHRAGSKASEIQRMGEYAIDDCLAIIAGRAPRYPVTQDMLATMA